MAYPSKGLLFMDLQWSCIDEQEIVIPPCKQDGKLELKLRTLIYSNADIIRKEMIWYLVVMLV